MQSNTPYDTKRSELVSELSQSTGVAEEDVEKVLEQLGLSLALQNAAEGVEMQRITASNAKVAFRIGRNTLVV